MKWLRRQLKLFYRVPIKRDAWGFGLAFGRVEDAVFLQLGPFLFGKWFR